jgi:MFS family permease
VPLNTIATTWPLLLGMGILMLGAGLQGSLLGVRATIENFPTAVIGAIMSCYYLGYLAGTVIAPRLVLKVGHIRVFAALAAVASASILVQGVWVHPAPWALMRLITGLCFAGIYVVAESWLNDRASRANRGRLLATYMLVLYVGLGLAQFLLTAASPRTTALFMLSSVLISLAMVPIVISAQKTPELAVPRNVQYRDLYRNSPLGVVAVIVSGFVAAIIFSMGPVYARLSGLGTADVARFMAVSIFAAAITQYPVGRLSDRMDRRNVIGAVCALTTIVAGNIALFPAMPHPLFLLLAAIFSGLVLTLYSLAVSHVNDQLEPAEMVAASSALLLLNGIGAAAGPVLAGAVIGAFGPPAYFITLATLTGALTIYDLWRKGRRRSPTQKRPFISAQPQCMTGQVVEEASARSISRDGNAQPLPP